MEKKEVETFLKKVVGFRPGEKVRIRVGNEEIEGTVVSQEGDFVFVKSGTAILRPHKTVPPKRYAITLLKWYRIENVESMEE